VSRIVGASAKILKFLVSDILDFARLKSAKFVKDVSQFDLRLAVEELVEVIQYQAERAGIRVLTDFGDFERVGFSVTTDCQRLQQILLNLMSNALKFTLSGSITIRCAPIFNQLLGKWFATFSVRDTGVGIKRQDQGKLFQMFGTLKRTSEQNSQGIGLGLAICKDIVEQFGGRIFVTSRWGKGSKFTFNFELPSFDLPPPAELVGFPEDSLDEGQESEEEKEEGEQVQPERHA